MTLFLFRTLSRLLELLCILFYPLLYLVLASKKYLEALQAQGPDSRQGLLVHAASVGEVNAVKPLILELGKKYPQMGIVITTTTVTGLKAARKLGYPARLAVLDLPWLRKIQLKTIDPRLIVIVETEMWFNLLDQAGKQRRNVVFVNARMSTRTHRRYYLFRGLLRRLQGPIRSIIAQSEMDRQRFRSIFTVPVTNAGNLKFAMQLPPHNQAELRAGYGFTGSDFVICLGSSRPGEEALMLNAMTELEAECPELKIVIAPRHPDRAASIRKLFPDSILLSDLPTSTRSGHSTLIVDSMGHLHEFYALCDLAVVGGSFFDFGGHNPLEPAYYGKPLIMGPHHSSCKASVTELQNYEAIVLADELNLACEIRALYHDPEKRARLGMNARKCLDENGHALQNHLKEVGKWL